MQNVMLCEEIVKRLTQLNVGGPYHTNPLHIRLTHTGAGGLYDEVGQCRYQWKNLCDMYHIMVLLTY